MAGTQGEAIIEDIYKNIEDMYARLDLLGTDIASLSARQHASDNNNMAFTLNTMCRSRAWTITALHHNITNQPIPGFPATAQELLDLNTADLDDIMVALGLPIDSPHDDKIKRLKAKAGLIPA